MTLARQWMDSHAIDVELAAELGLHADEDGTLYVPYRRADGTYFERWRKFPDGPWMQPKGETLGLYWPLGRSVDVPVILTEGEGDTLACASVIDSSHHVALGHCPVGLPGASMNAEKVAAELVAQQVPYAFLILDPDEAGRTATERLTLALTVAGTDPIPIELPEGRDLAECLHDAEDPEDYLANLLADQETLALQRRDSILTDSIREKLAHG